MGPLIRLKGLEVVKIGTNWKVVKVGTKVEVNYGAGIPKEYGVVTAIKNAGTYFYAVIEGDGFTMTAHDIKPPGTLTANGSGIGVFAV